jgi:prephenate dehydratase
MKVAIQGTFGAFHEVAAREFFGDHIVDIVPCERFEDEFVAISENRADCAVIAVENSVAGTLLSNLSLIAESGMGIFAEHYLRIEQNLMALKGETISDIREVRSHPVAIQQCRDFLEDLRRDGVTIVDHPDTAMSARDIASKGLRGVAAIAGVSAAEKYDLSVLASGIESNKNNFTRFLFVAPLERRGDLGTLYADVCNKSSICFTLPHKPGKLAAVLAQVSRYGLDLTKIQSLPVPGREWEYLFFLDMTFDDRRDYLSVIRELEKVCDKLTLLGEYRRGAVASLPSMQLSEQVDDRKR